MSEKISGRIFLIPSSLGDEGAVAIPAETRQIVLSIDFFIVENERSTRRFLRSIGYTKNFDEGNLLKVERDEDFKGEEKLLHHLKKGNDAGVISEAGCPGIADPGAAVVQWAYQHKIKVVPLVGPSAIFMGLMASGLNGQQFAFHGYLPVSSPERRNKLKQLEEESQRKKQTQIFMETPYRNDSLLKDLLDACKPSTSLCIASDITLPTEKIYTCSVAEWKKHIPDLKKKPTIFLMLAS
jgi:16S rRNA (cytidine1402-2'-O)-methyltransferase